MELFICLLFLFNLFIISFSFLFTLRLLVATFIFFSQTLTFVYLLVCFPCVSFSLCLCVLCGRGSTSIWHLAISWSSSSSSTTVEELGSDRHSLPHCSVNFCGHNSLDLQSFGGSFPTKAHRLYAKFYKFNPGYTWFINPIKPLQYHMKRCFLFSLKQYRSSVSVF